MSKATAEYGTGQALLHMLNIFLDIGTSELGSEIRARVPVVIKEYLETPQTRDKINEICKVASNHLFLRTWAIGPDSDLLLFMLCRLNSTKKARDPRVCAQLRICEQ